MATCLARSRPIRPAPRQREAPGGITSFSGNRVSRAPIAARITSAARRQSCLSPCPARQPARAHRRAASALAGVCEGTETWYAGDMDRQTLGTLIVMAGVASIAFSAAFDWGFSEALE